MLNLSHEDGSGKAQFFIHFGFSVAQWQLLVAALIQHAHEHPVVKQAQNAFGVRYVIEGNLRTPSGRSPRLRSVWFIKQGESQPRLVTAYPLEAENDSRT